MGDATVLSRNRSFDYVPLFMSDYISAAVTIDTYSADFQYLIFIHN